MKKMVKHTNILGETIFTNFAGELSDDEISHKAQELGITDFEIVLESDVLKSVDTPKQQRLKEIAVLEASITPRRLREALISDAGKAWLKSIEDKIFLLRGML